MLIDSNEGASNAFFMVLSRVAFEIFIERLDAAVKVRALVSLVDTEDRCVFYIGHPVGVEYFLNALRSAGVGAAGLSRADRSVSRSRLVSDKRS